MCVIEPSDKSEFTDLGGEKPSEPQLAAHNIQTDNSVQPQDDTLSERKTEDSTQAPIAVTNGEQVEQNHQVAGVDADSAIITGGERNEAVPAEGASSSIDESRVTVDAGGNQVHDIAQNADQSTALHGESNEVGASSGSSSNNMQDVVQAVGKTDSNEEQFSTDSLNTVHEPEYGVYDANKSDTGGEFETVVSENEVNLILTSDRPPASDDEQGHYHDVTKQEDTPDQENVIGGDVLAASIVEHYLLIISDCISLIDPLLQSAIDSVRKTYHVDMLLVDIISL